MHAFVLLVLLLASTGAAATANGPPPDAGMMCPSIYQPVCARKGDESRMFANACLARRAGFVVVARQSCGGDSELPRFQ